MIIGVQLPAELELAQMIQAGNGLPFSFGRAKHREEQAGQDGDDGDDHEEFDESKRAPDRTARLSPNQNNERVLDMELGSSSLYTKRRERF